MFPKHLDYRRVTKLREIRRMRRALFNEVENYRLARIKLTDAIKSHFHNPPAGDTAYVVLYRFEPLSISFTDSVSDAVDMLYNLRQLAFEHGLIRIHETIQNM